MCNAGGKRLPQTGAAGLVPLAAAAGLAALGGAMLLRRSRA
ncbi:LPXTG cell wall anchor domain-containing protein [Gulosibacter sp. 401352-2018]